MRASPWKLDFIARDSIPSAQTWTGHRGSHAVAGLTGDAAGPTGQAVQPRPREVRDAPALRPRPASWNRAAGSPRCNGKYATGAFPMTQYAHPEVLVTTEWLAGHLTDPQVRVLEVDYDPSASYELGHIPGAALVDWKRDINDTVRRDILSKGQFEHLLSRVGATPDTTLVLYGDFRNWFAAFAFWTFRIYGHRSE